MDVSPLNERPLSEIEDSLEKFGFPEIRLVWAYAMRKSFPEKEITEETILRRRTKHMAPLFGHPFISLVIILALSSLFAWFGEYLLSLAFSLPAYFSSKNYEFGEISKPHASAYNTVKFLFSMSLTALFLLMLEGTLQRYVFFPFNRIIALDLTFMMRKASWRSWLDYQPSSIAFCSSLLRRGITSYWDNPEYVIRYRTTGNDFSRSQVRTRCEIILHLLREFLGHMDVNTKKYVPGRFPPQLFGGKGKISQFLNTHAEEMTALRNDDLTPEECRALLLSLHGIITPGSSADGALTKALDALDAEVFLEEGETQAEIWQREPLADLTHQEEFFSSASLRGVKLMGRGARGRISPFGYLRNKAISALDFRSRKGRVVRARIAAAEITNGPATGTPVLFVDGVEGSNRLPSQVIKKGLMDYAHACAFRYIVFNALVHNKVPARFLKALAAVGLTPQEIGIRYLIAHSREYLDAFGFPLQPIEYDYPAGHVVAYILEVETGHEILLGHKWRLRNKIWQFFRMNCYSLLAASSMALGSIIALLLAPFICLAFVGVALVLALAHYRYRQKALRVCS